MLMRMPAQIHSFININTVEPNSLIRHPAYFKNGVPSDKQILRLKGVIGPAGVACVILYGKVDSSYLRDPTEVNGSRVARHRAIIVSSYRETFKRLTGLYSNATGEKEEFLFLYGRSRVALTQSPEALANGGSNFESDSEIDSESNEEKNKRDAMR